VVVDLASLRDPNDAPILGTAIAARAEVLVSGDNDLLVLGTFQSIPILSPRDFHNRHLAPKT
jgi:predicted nucleic acid-binding protein